MGLNNQQSKITPLWVTKLDSKFNTLAIGPVFRESAKVLVSGGEDGSVRVYSLPSRNDRVPDNLQCVSCLESKGGPIQTLALEDVTRFGSRDVLVGDSRGTLTVFSQGQIVSRQALSQHVIRALVVEQDELGNMAIITADNEGAIIASLPNTILWKTRLADFPAMKGQRSRVQALVTVSLMNAAGSSSNYVLATDDQRHLYVLQRSTIVLVLDTPANITAMCVGRFVSDVAQRGVSGDGSSTNPRQVALGGDNGAIYIFSNFEIYQGELGTARLPITSMRTLETDGPAPDAVICAGHFNGVLIFSEGKCIGQQQTPDWVNSIQTTGHVADHVTDHVADHVTDGTCEVVLGCMDNSVCAYRIQVT